MVRLVYIKDLYTYIQVRLVVGKSSTLHNGQYCRFDAVFPVLAENADAVPTCTAVQMYNMAKLFLKLFNPLKEELMFERMMKYLVGSLSLDSPKHSFIGVFLIKDYSVSWIKLVKDLCTTSTSILTTLNPNIQNYNKKIAFYVLVLISFTSASTWKIAKSKALSALAPHLTQLSHNISGHLVEAGLMKNLKTVLLKGLALSKVFLKKTTLSAINSLCLRPVIYSNFSEKLVSIYILNILSVPSLIYQTQQLCPEIVTMMKSNHILKHTIRLLAQEQQLKIHFNALEGSYALCLCGNLINLLHLESVDGLQEDIIGKHN